MAAASHGYNFCFIFLPKEFCSYSSASLVIVEVGRGMEEKDLRKDIGEGHYKQRWKEKGEGGRKMKGEGWES